MASGVPEYLLIRLRDKQESTSLPNQRLRSLLEPDLSRAPSPAETPACGRAKGRTTHPPQSRPDLGKQRSSLTARRRRARPPDPDRGATGRTPASPAQRSPQPNHRAGTVPLNFGASEGPRLRGVSPLLVPSICLTDALHLSTPGKLWKQRSDSK